MSLAWTAARSAVALDYVAHDDGVPVGRITRGDAGDWHWSAFGI